MGWSVADVRDAVRRHHAPQPGGDVVSAHAQAEGFKAAVEWRDTGRPIPEGDEARELARTLRDHPRSK